MSHVREIALPLRELPSRRVRSRWGMARNEGAWIGVRGHAHRDGLVLPLLCPGVQCERGDNGQVPITPCHHSGFSNSQPRRPVRDH